MSPTSICSIGFRLPSASKTGVPRTKQWWSAGVRSFGSKLVPLGLAVWWRSGRRGPALVCAGSADPWSDAAVTAEIVASLKRPELVAIDGAGHLPNLEAEAQFNEALLAFLGRHAP